MSLSSDSAPSKNVLHRDDRIVGQQQKPESITAEIDRAFSLLGRCWREGVRQGIVVNARPVWVRNYCTYFSVYSVRCVARLRAGSDSPGDTSVAIPVRSQVFERRWPPGPVAIFKTDRVGRRCWAPASVGYRRCNVRFALADIASYVPIKAVKGFGQGVIRLS